MKEYELTDALRLVPMEERQSSRGRAAAAQDKPQAVMPFGSASALQATTGKPWKSLRARVYIWAFLGLGLFLFLPVLLAHVSSQARGKSQGSTLLNRAPAAHSPSPGLAARLKSPSEFVYYSAEAIGAPVPYAPDSISHPGLTGKQRKHLAKTSFTEDDPIPPEFNTE